MRLAHLFFNVNMSLGHTGLSLMMQQKRKKLDNAGDCAIFINTAFTSVKILTFGASFFSYYKHQSGKLDPATIKDLPRYLDGGQIRYSAALKKVIDKHFEKREKERVT